METVHKSDTAPIYFIVSKSSYNLSQPAQRGQAISDMENECTIIRKTVAYILIGEKLFLYQSREPL